MNFVGDDEVEFIPPKHERIIAMYLKLTDGPMDGAEYALSKLREEPSTNRKPDGVWFDAIDDQGRNIKHEYKFDRTGEKGNHVTLEYRYDGIVVDTGIEMETEEKIEPWCNTAMQQPSHDRASVPDEVSKPIRDATSAVMNEGKIHGCIACGEERPAVNFNGALICPECHSDNIACIE
jgi:hypothetical protein